MTKRKNIKRSRDPLLQAILSQAGDQEFFGKEGFFQQLKQRLVNEMLEGELEEDLGYNKHSRSDKDDDNRRNGYYPKQVISDGDNLSLNIPRDRNGDYEPKLVPKGVRRLDGFDDKVISMYARGMSMSEIKEHIYEIYGTEVSSELISNVTDRVINEVNTWQNRPLDSLYPIVYLDCIHVKTRDNNMVHNKAVYLALAINMEGQKEILGIWISKNEGAKFWLNVITEIKNRGVNDILIACVDGLKGFEEAINTVFPQTQVQLCIVHIIRNSLRFVPWKDRKSVAADLRLIYTAPNEAAALQALENFKAKWDNKYPTISDIWERNWSSIIPCLSYPADIRKVIYTTNAIESVNRQIRKIIKNKGVFPNDESVKKSLFLALKNAQKKWTMPIRSWAQALNQFAIIFNGRINF